MKKNIPSKLYKYGSIEKPEYLREILLENKLYCSSPFDFNDPFDCRPRVVVGSTEQELRDARKNIEKTLQNKTKLDRNSRRVKAKQILKEIEKCTTLQSRHRSLLSRAGVYCLSEKKDNLLMWAHYSDKHKGFCLEFSTEPEGSFFSLAEAVQYSRNYPVVKIFAADNHDWGKECFLSKSVDWKYEQEWRLTSKQLGHINFPPETLIGLILGCRMSEKDRKQFLEWNAVRQPSVKIYQATIHEREFRVQIYPI